MCVPEWLVSCVLFFAGFVVVTLVFLINAFNSPLLRVLWKIIYSQTASLMYSNETPTNCCAEHWGGGQTTVFPRTPDLVKLIAAAEMPVWRLGDGEHLKGLAEKISFLKHVAYKLNYFIFFFLPSFFSSAQPFVLDNIRSVSFPVYVGWQQQGLTMSEIAPSGFQGMGWCGA